MKSFKEYLFEDDIVLSKAVSRGQAPPHYKNFMPLNSETLLQTHDKIKTFKHKGQIYHLYQSRDSDFKDTMFRLVHSGADGNIKEIGRIGMLSNPSRQLAHDKIQTQLNRKYEAISLEPEFHPLHTGTGLVSKVYKMVANHTGRDIISDYSQTRGSQNVWTELSKSGKVTGVHTHKKFTPFEYDPKNEDHTDRIYKGGENALLHYSHEGRVIL